MNNNANNTEISVNSAWLEKLMTDNAYEVSKRSQQYDIDALSCAEEIKTELKELVRQLVAMMFEERYVARRGYTRKGALNERQYSERLCQASVELRQCLYRGQVERRVSYVDGLLRVNEIRIYIQYLATAIAERIAMILASSENEMVLIDLRRLVSKAKSLKSEIINELNSVKDIDCRRILETVDEFFEARTTEFAAVAKAWLNPQSDLQAVGKNIGGQFLESYMMIPIAQPNKIQKELYDALDSFNARAHEMRDLHTFYCHSKSNISTTRFVPALERALRTNDMDAFEQVSSRQLDAKAEMYQVAVKYVNLHVEFTDAAERLFAAEKKLNDNLPMQGEVGLARRYTNILNCSVAQAQLRLMVPVEANYRREDPPQLLRDLNFKPAEYICGNQMG